MASYCLLPSASGVNWIVCCLLVLVCLDDFWQFSFMPVQATQAAAVSWPSLELRDVWSSGMQPLRAAASCLFGVSPKSRRSPCLHPVADGMAKGVCQCLLCPAVSQAPRATIRPL